MTTRLALLLTLAVAALGHAADFVLTVDPSVDAAGAEAELHAALAAAEANSEADTVLLFPNGAYSMTTSGPDLTTEISILGNEATLTYVGTPGNGNVPLGGFKGSVEVSDLTLDSFDIALRADSGFVRLVRLNVLNSTIQGLGLRIGFTHGSGPIDVHILRSTFDAPTPSVAAAMSASYGPAPYRWFSVLVEDSLIRGHEHGVEADTNTDGRIELRNTTITGTEESAIFNPGKVLVVLGSTIAGNGVGGMETSAVVSSGAVLVGNSIIAGNATGSAYEIDLPGSPFVQSFGYNILGAGVASTTQMQPTDQLGTPGAPLDPMLEPLADNGGPTLSFLPGAGSPALDAGGLLHLVDTDQRGYPRDPAAPDIGAVEVVDTTGPTVGITAQGASPTNRDVVAYDVVFDQDVGESFTLDDLTLTGSLSAGASALLAGSGTTWVVRLVPDDPNAEGTLGFDLTGEVFGPVPANPLVVPVSSSLTTLDNPLGDKDDDGTVDAAELNEVVLEYRGIDP